LREDLLAAAPDSTSQWRRWLESGSEQSRRLTFDAALASSGDIELLSPVHDLVRVAAAQEETFAPESTVGLRVRSTSLPEGSYPVAVHSWTYLGARDDFEVVVTVTAGDLANEIERTLVDAVNSDESPAELTSSLDDAHYAAWSDARGTHMDRTRAHVESQLVSLTATHQARQQLLEDQILSATHDNIRRMRESELRSLDEDFEVRRRRLEDSIRRSDITTSLLCTGTVEIVHG